MLICFGTNLLVTVIVLDFDCTPHKSKNKHKHKPVRNNILGSHKRQQSFTFFNFFICWLRWFAVGVCHLFTNTNVTVNETSHKTNRAWGFTATFHSTSCFTFLLANGRSRHDLFLPLGTLSVPRQVLSQQVVMLSYHESVLLHNYHTYWNTTFVKE